MKKIRVTGKYLCAWLTQKFKEVEIPFEVIECHRTRFRGNEYEGGACFLIFRAVPIDKKQKDTFSSATILCFYPMSQLQQYLNDGYELCFKLNKHGILNDSELDIRKTTRKIEKP